MTATFNSITSFNNYDEVWASSLINKNEIGRIKTHHKQFEINVSPFHTYMASVHIKGRVMGCGL